MTTKFKDNFIDWLNTSLSENIPSEVEAFCFNLDYPAGEYNVKYQVELIGTNRYDKTDEDWACEEVWVPKQRGIFIPILFSTNDWKMCQLKIKFLIEEYLFSINIFADKLKQHKAIAIGFVDGNLKSIWTNSDSNLMD